MSLLLILGALKVGFQWPKTTEGGELSKTRTSENIKTTIFKTIIIFLQNLVVCSGF